MARTVLLAGGGSAGHVNPLLSVADELRDLDPAIKIVVLGTDSGLEVDLVPARGYELTLIPRVPLPRRISSAWIAFPNRLRAAIKAAGAAMDEHDVDVVVGFGGYVSTPAYLAARKRRIPIVVQEQNTRPGLANRLGARIAVAVAVAFPGTPLRGARVMGLPLRREIAQLLIDRSSSPEQTRQRAAQALGLDPEVPTLVVTGGSLGAMSLNTAMVSVLPQLDGVDIQVLHLTGLGKSSPILAALESQKASLRDRYHVREYAEDMQQVLAVADLVLCRAGAGTVAELTALGIPGAYVPLPIGNGEQRWNAQPVADAGGGLIVEDAALSGEWISGRIIPLLQNPVELQTLAEAATQVGRTDGAALVADLVMNAMSGDVK